MSSKPYLTTDDLIEEVKNNISFPLNQSTFTESDVIKFINKELMISQVPSVMEFHEKFLTHEIRVPLVADVQKYAIPNRAIGMKINDIWYEDENGNETEMTLIDDGNKAHFQDNSFVNNEQHKFYIQGNYVVLVTGVGSAPTGDLVFSIFLRPNQLVSNDRAAIIESFNKKVTISNADITNGDTITILDEVFTVGTDFAKGASSTATAANLVVAINNNGIATSSNIAEVVSIAFTDRDDPIDGVETDNEDGFVISDNYTLAFEDELGDHFVANAKIDFLQTNPGHQIYDFDKIPVALGASDMDLDPDDIPDDLEVGDYVCLSHECIIPGIPPELHHVLAERTCARILSAIGDQQGLAASMMKIKEMENSQGTLIDNRVENSPKKILNRSSPLRLGKLGNYRRRT